jgi:hypothetical protein
VSSARAGSVGRLGAVRLPTVVIAASPAVLVIALTILAWPIPHSPATSALDESWQIALNLAAAMGLRHGVDFVFTYGPLGFLGSPLPYVGATSTLALAATIAIYLALIGTMLAEARRILPTWAAALVTLLAARTFVYLPPFEAFQILIFVWCVETLAGRIPLPTTTLAVVGGMLAAAGSLGKLNVGIFVVAMGAVTITVIGRPWWRALGVYVAVGAVTGVGLWLATGQQLGDVGAYVTGVYQVISGYNESMGTDPQPERAWIFLALAVAAAICVWIGWQGSRDWPRRQRIGLAVVGLVFGFALWKTSVVRDHATYAFASAIVAMFPFAPRIERRTWLIAVLGLGVAFAGSSAIQPRTYLDVVDSTRSIYHEVIDAFVPGRTSAAAERTRDQLRARYGLEPSTLAAIGGQTVHVDPYQASVAAAYPDLSWAPLPVVQSYSAYTSDLDRLDAERLRSPAAPERILRNFRAALPTDRLRRSIGRPLHDGEILPLTVDGRFRWFEAPAATLETFCRYVQTAASDRWQVLARTGRSCGTPEALGTVVARAGETVAVPVETRPDRFVTVRIGGLEPSPLGRLRAALYKGPDWYVKLDDTRYRLVPGTAGDGLLLAVPPVADGTGPFAFGAPIGTMTITSGQSGRGSTAPLTYEFLSVPLRP